MDGTTPAVACDHYHRYPEDFALMRELGVRNYRLSLSWPRIIPDGDGQVNQRGLDFYHRLFASLKEHGITPWVTLFHWDLPQALQEDGGWVNRKTVDAFARFADIVVKEFSGEVKHWFTTNEIECFTKKAHTGNLNKAPGLPLPKRDVHQTMHHGLMAHSHGVRAVRAHGGPGALVGPADCGHMPIPFDESSPDCVEAAKASFIEENALTLAALLLGKYPDCATRLWGEDAPMILPGDDLLLAQPCDFIGLNIYSGGLMRQARNGHGWEQLPLPKAYPASTYSVTSFSAPSIYWGTRFAAEISRTKSIFISENGYGTTEPATPDANGEILDLHRREYLRQYLRELQRATADGVPVRGYFCWSFTDNFEWSYGTEIRFGLVHIDYATQKRTPKLSARWYARVIAQNRVV